MVHLGQVCGYAAGKYLVPLARANTEHCLRLAKRAKALCLSSRQLKLVYDAWRTSNHEEREHIVARPDFYLQVLAESQRSDQPIPDERVQAQERMLNDLRKVGLICRHVRQQLKAILPLLPGVDEMELLLDVWKNAGADFSALATVMREVSHA